MWENILISLYMETIHCKWYGQACELMDGYIFRSPIQAVTARLLEYGHKWILCGHNQAETVQAEGEVGDGAGGTAGHVAYVREVPWGVEPDPARLGPHQDRVDGLALLQVGENQGRDPSSHRSLTNL